MDTTRPEPAKPDGDRCDARIDAFLLQHVAWAPSPDDPRLSHAFVEVPLDYADPGGSA